MYKDIWKKCDRRKAVTFGSILLAVVVAEIVLTCLIPTWRDGFFTIMKEKDQGNFNTYIIYFFLLMFVLGAVQGIKVWIGQLFSFQFRIASSKLLLKTWVHSKRTAQNYTQAMTEAIRNATELYVSVGVEIAISAFIVVTLIISNIHNHSILFAALAYTIVVSAIATLFNKPLINTDANWQSAEGLYREAISDIANGNGDYTAKAKFLTLIKSYLTYIRTVMYFVLFSRLKGALASVVPYVLLSANYFNGVTTFGEFMAGVAVFELLVINATIIVIVYPQITKARASIKIMKNFYGEVLKGK